MTEQTKNKSLWLALLGGIPLASVATFLFTAGQLRTDYDVVKAQTFEASRCNVTQETRLLKLEMTCEYMRSGIDEIKADLKDIKRSVNRP